MSGHEDPPVELSSSDGEDELVEVEVRTLDTALEETASRRVADREQVTEVVDDDTGDEDVQITREVRRTPPPEPSVPSPMSFLHELQRQFFEMAERGDQLTGPTVVLGPSFGSGAGRRPERSSRSSARERAARNMLNPRHSWLMADDFSQGDDGGQAHEADVRSARLRTAAGRVHHHPYHMLHHYHHHHHHRPFGPAADYAGAMEDAMMQAIMRSLDDTGAPRRSVDVDKIRKPPEPAPARDEYTRELREDGESRPLCAYCDVELGVGIPEGEKALTEARRLLSKRVFFARCGHVYCGNCVTDLTDATARKGRKLPRTCVVPGCRQRLNVKNPFFEVYY